MGIHRARASSSRRVRTFYTLGLLLFLLCLCVCDAAP